MFILFLQVKLGIFVRYWRKLEKSYRNMIIISYNKDFRENLLVFCTINLDKFISIS